MTLLCITLQYSVSSVALPMEWVFPNSTVSADLLGLQPGTGYNVSVKAKTTDGYGIPSVDTFTTEIGGTICVKTSLVCKRVHNIYKQNHINRAQHPIRPTGPL